jgi:hypothetical protein
MVVWERHFTSAIPLWFANIDHLVGLPLIGLGQSAGQQSPMNPQATLPDPSDDLLAKLEDIYKDIHACPGPAMQRRTPQFITLRKPC